MRGVDHCLRSCRGALRDRAADEQRRRHACDTPDEEAGDRY
jgi:hypothetical protein